MRGWCQRWRTETRERARNSGFVGELACSLHFRALLCQCVLCGVKVILLYESLNYVRSLNSIRKIFIFQKIKIC